jgi:hypothetical protein
MYGEIRYLICFCHPEAVPTQYLHKLWFHGKEDLSKLPPGVQQIKNIPKIRKELVVMFDSGAPVDVVDMNVGHELFHEFPKLGPSHVIGGRVTESELLFVGYMEISGKLLDCTFEATQLSDWKVDGLQLDVVIGLPTMRKWGIVLDTSNGGIAIKVIEPISIPLLSKL